MKKYPKKHLLALLGGLIVILLFFPKPANQRHLIPHSQQSKKSDKYEVTEFGEYKLPNITDEGAKKITTCSENLRLQILKVLMLDAAKYLNEKDPKIFPAVSTSHVPINKEITEWKAAHKAAFGDKYTDRVEEIQSLKVTPTFNVFVLAHAQLIRRTPTRSLDLTAKPNKLAVHEENIKAEPNSQQAALMRRFYFRALIDESTGLQQQFYKWLATEPLPPYPHIERDLLNKSFPAKGIAEPNSLTETLPPLTIFPHLIFIPDQLRVVASGFGYSLKTEYPTTLTMTPFRADIGSFTLADLLQKLPGEGAKVEIKDHTITISNYPTPVFSVEASTHKGKTKDALWAPNVLKLSEDSKFTIPKHEFSHGQAAPPSPDGSGFALNAEHATTGF
jgi:hypothetical protein